MDLIEPNEVSILDSNSSWHGIDISVLMENAGAAMAGAVVDYCDECRVTFVCGGGNNGGDGFVAARLLKERGYDVRVVLMKSPDMIRTDLARNAFDSLPEEINVYVLGDDMNTSSFGTLLSDSDVLVDGLLGAGAQGEPRGLYWEAVRLMNGSGTPIMAIDMPTGIGYEPCIKARVTVTFHEPKTTMYVDGRPHPYCGEIVVQDIGIPPEASIFLGSGDIKRFPVLKGDAKKGDGGKVLVIGGGPFTGAPALAAMGAVRSGADLVRVAVPRGIGDIIASFSMDLIVNRLATVDPYKLDTGVIDRLKLMVDWADCVLVGPGSGSSETALDTMAQIIAYSIEKGVRAVVDADAITALSERFPSTTELLDKPDQILLTPHRGEMIRLLKGFDIIPQKSNISDPYKRSKGRPVDLSVKMMDGVASLCNSHRVEVLLKGPLDVIVSSTPHPLGERIEVSTKNGVVTRRLNSTGIPAMSTGGTGDILSGLCAGFMSRGMSAFDSGGLAAFVNGMAGEATFEEIGHSISAEEMLGRIRIGR